MRKINKLVIFSLCLAAVMGSAKIILADMISPGGYQIWADVISEGGIENSASANYTLGDTIAEALIGPSSTTNSGLYAGFRQMEKNQLLSLSISTGSLNLGQLSDTAAKTATHTLSLLTNSATGVRVTFSGNTLSGTAGTIPAIGATAAASAPGTGQFGLNVIYASGDAAAASQAPYNNAAQYAFDSSLPLITSSGPVSGTDFLATYLANISSGQAAGSYSTAITYTAVANF